MVYEQAKAQMNVETDKCTNGWIIERWMDERKDDGEMMAT